jgi:hypothetical protein
MTTERLVTIKSSGGNYTSLSAAEAGEQDDYVSDDVWMHYSCYSMEDATAVTFSGSTTDLTRYILVDTPASERHSGKWSASKYRLVVTDADVITVDNELCIRFDGLQLEVMSPTAIRKVINFCNAPSNDFDYRVSKTIIRSSDYGANRCNGIDFYFTGPSRTGTLKIWDCLFYDLAGIDVYIHDTCTPYFYNNTVICLYYGFSIGTFSGIAVNNLFTTPSAWSCYGTFAAGTDYNITSDIYGIGYTVTGGGNTHDHDSHTYTFVDADNDDYHLASTDAGAIGFGMTDPGSGLFSDDIDGNTRSAPWDVGADEYVAGGTLSGSSAIVFSATGALLGDKALSGSAPIAVSSTGNLLGVYPLTGSSIITVSTASNLKYNAALAGSLAVAFTASGLLYGDFALSAMAILSFLSSGTLTDLNAQAFSPNLQEHMQEYMQEFGQQ